MSQNHLRGDKESPYRKTGVGAKYNNSSDYQQRPLSGGSGPGTASSLSSNASASRSFKKRNNAQVGQYRGYSGPVNPSSDPNPTTAARHVENGSQVQSTVTGESQKPAAAATPKPADALRQKSSQPVPKAPSSLTASMASDSTSSTTPSKGDAGKGFPLQFGSISPGFMNVPARTSSAPPNLDEQQRNQAFRTASKASPPNPAPTAPKQQMPNPDVPTEKPTTQGSRKTPLMGTSPAPPVQTQKPGVLPVPGTSMSMPFTQPNNPLPFGGPNTQIPSHVIRPNSHQMPQMPLSIGNSSQVQPPLYVPGYTQHHIMQNQGMIAQGLSYGYNPPLHHHHQLPHQPRNLGSSPQVNLQGGNFNNARIAIKITNPETLEELQLDNKSGGGSLSSQVNHTAHSYTAPHPGSFYPNSYTSGSPYTSQQSLVPPTSASHVPRYSYPTQGAPVVPYVNQATSASLSVPGRRESSNIRPFTPSPQASVPVTIKPAVTSTGNTNVVEKGGPVSVSRSAAEAAVGSKELKVTPASSSPSLKTRLESLNQSDAVVTTNIKADADKETVVDLNTLKGAQEQSGQKGHLQASSQDYVNLSKVANSESAAAKGNPTSPGSKAGVLDVAPASDRAIDDKPSMDHPAGEEDSNLHFVTKKSEAEHSKSLQLDNPSKATNAVFKPEQPDEPKKSHHEAESASSHHSGTNVKSEVESVEYSRPSSSLGVASKLPAGEEDSNLQSLTKKSEAERSESLQLDDLSKATSAVSKPEQPNETKKSHHEAESAIAHHSGTNVKSEAESVNNSRPSSSSGVASILPAGEEDNNLQSVTKKGEAQSSESLQLDNPSKATNVSKPEQPDETKKSHHETEFASAHHSETDVKSEAESVDDSRPSSSSGVASKLPVEPNKTKNNKGKKKRKEMFQKAESLGINPDLYMAYKGPKEHKETVAVEESVHDDNTKEVSTAELESAAKEIDEQKKPELENWEDIADGSTPKLKSTDSVQCGGVFDQVDDGAALKKYTRDFLLTISEQCTILPKGFQITPEIAEVLSHSNMNDSRSYSNTARINDRSSGAARNDRRGNGSMDTDRWAKPNPHIDVTYANNMNNMMGFWPGQGPNYGAVRPPGQGPPVQHAGGILPGLVHNVHYMGFQAPHRNNLEVNRWDRGKNFYPGLMPPPQTPQSVMHRAEKKYEVGKVSDEEQAKQRRLKAILNKLTPQNFEKLFEQVKEVKIDNVVTLTGVISQIFDKALMEPTFCEMYSNFCQHLATELPELSVDNQKITFRRLLLNKCQEEFERGEREEEEVNKDEGETKQTDQEREEKRLKVRRRMLGNIRLIGELYKKRMLTERIMHECIKKLLGDYQNADEENIEALCKLMSTIGEMIDHPKAKEHMDAYFDIMRQLSNDMKLSSRVRFMLKDTIDLRKNRWQQRMKVEGPKKIEEVHRAAAQERLGQGVGSTSRLTRGPSMNSAIRRAPPMEYAPRSSVLSSPVGGGYRGLGPQFRGQDLRGDDKSEFENRTLSVPLLQRSSGYEPVFGPQGGLGRRMSTTRQQPSASVGPTADISSSQGPVRREVGGLNGYNSPGNQFPKQAVPGADAYAGNQVGYPNATQKGSSEKAYPEERLREMSMAAIKEYYSAKDVVEAELCIKELNAPNFYPTLISMWVADAFERKDMERNVLAKLLVSLTKSRERIFNQQQLIQGFESVLKIFEDTVTDAPKAPEYLGRMFGTLILEDVLPLPDVCRLIHQGGDEPGRLREVGLAADLLGCILEVIKAEKGDATLNEIRTSSNLRLHDYMPPEPLKSRKLEMFL